MDIEESYGPVLRVPIDQITIDEHHPGQDRFTDKDLHQLADSIKDVGLINPITLSPGRKLVSGLNRLRACRDILGLTLIDARTLKGSADEDYELHPAVVKQVQYGENVARKAMSAAEATDLARQIRELKGLTKAEAQAKAAEVSGISARSQQRVETIQRAAQDEDPQVAAAAAEALEDLAEGGSVGAAEAKVKAARDQGPASAQPEPAGEDDDPEPLDEDGGLPGEQVVAGPAPVTEDAAVLVEDHDQGHVEEYREDLSRDVRTALVGLIKIAEQSDSIVMLEPGDLQEGLDRLTGPMYGKLQELLSTLNDAMARREREAA